MVAGHPIQLIGILGVHLVHEQHLVLNSVHLVLIVFYLLNLLLNLTFVKMLIFVNLIRFLPFVIGLNKTSIADHIVAYYLPSVDLWLFFNLGGVIVLCRSNDIMSQVHLLVLLV